MNRHYLTFASLSKEASARAMIRALSPGDPNRAMDTHHQLVWSLFASDDRPNESRSFLWRVDGDRFVILSEEPPRDAHSLFEMDTRRFDASFSKGDRLVFRLRVNATVCRTQNVNGSRRQHRHDVVMDTIRRIQEENPDAKRSAARELAVPRAAREWLDRTGEGAGFALKTLSTTSYRTVDLGRARGRKARFGVLDVDGDLEVLEPDRLLDRICQGFGRAKAFGCGLMLLKT